MRFTGGIFEFRTAAFVGVLLGLAVGPAAAMTFSTSVSSDGNRFVIAKGEIMAGDSDRLRTALKSADRNSSGHKIVALDSGGGSVMEAFLMVEVMDREKVSTVIPSGAACASACAQILFLSGIHRTVEVGGRLGLHSCYDSRERSRSLVCNELIAQNAMARGTPYGSIMAFMHLGAPTQMRWLDATDADCWGFTTRSPDTGSDRQRRLNPLACGLGSETAKVSSTSPLGSGRPHPSAL
jgi:hypothetical protein